MTEEEVAAHNWRIRNREKVAPAPAKTHNQKQAMIGRTPRGTMNKTEARYAREVLEPRRFAKEIDGWAYEILKFRLADGAWYCPDFITTKGLQITCIEVKGFLREASLIRIKVAAEQHKFFKFVMVRLVKGQWIYREF